MKPSQIPGYRKVKKIVKFAQLLYFSKRNIDPLRNYLIFSDPRGGSTWLSEIIKDITKQSVLWEPLHLKRVNQFKDIGFGWRQYIPENEKWLEAKNTFDDLFEGKIINNWIIKRTTPRELLSSDQLIIKFCNGNSLLPYLTSNYNFYYKPIYMIRHPFAVVSSQLNHGSWDFNYKDFDIPKVPYNEIYKIHKEFLSTLKTKEEALTATWCISNQITLNNRNNNNNWITMNYEELLLNPEDSINRILNEWNIDFDIKSIKFNKKSATAISGSPISGIEQLKYWQKNLDSNQIDRMKDVLNYFNLKEYSEKPEPLFIYK